MSVSYTTRGADHVGRIRRGAVAPRPTVDDIHLSINREQRVVPLAAEEPVRPGAADEGVVTRAAVEHIVPAAAVDRVDATEAADDVVAVCADECVCALGPLQRAERLPVTPDRGRDTATVWSPAEPRELGPPVAAVGLDQDRRPVPRREDHQQRGVGRPDQACEATETATSSQPAGRSDRDETKITGVLTGVCDVTAVGRPGKLVDSQTG